MKKFRIITFGCQMNEDDSNSIKFFLENLGLEEETSKTADIIIINTCTVRQHAEDKALSTLGTLKKWKTKDRKIFFIGCAAERLRNEIKRKFKHIDYVIGAKSYFKIYDILLKELDIKTGVNPDFKPKRTQVFDYETILRGCNLKCSYCIVPDVRGKEEIKPFWDIIKSVKEKAAKGVKEIVLLGQTVNSYYDRKEKKDFTDLLNEISAIDEIKIIRFLSPHPLFFNSKFFDEYKKNPKISRWIHLPLQSGSDRILKKMKRGYDFKKFKETVMKLKESDPNTSITTDLIVGYTDETEYDFDMTVKAVREIGFSMAYCFKYSPRFKDRYPLTITKAELKKRHKILLDEVKRISKDIINKKMNCVEELLLHYENSGRTNTGYNCCIIDNKEVKKDFLKVIITDIKNNTLYGRVYDKEN